MPTDDPAMRSREVWSIPVQRERNLLQASGDANAVDSATKALMFLQIASTLVKQEKDEGS